jgi:hypothetical protein
MGGLAEACHPTRFLMAGMLCLFAAQPARCQDETAGIPEAEISSSAHLGARTALLEGIDLRRESSSAVAFPEPTRFAAAFAHDESPAKRTATRMPVESNLVIEGLASYGHYKIFASGSGTKLYTAGIEYDRHSFGRFLGARMDYVAELLPLVLLDAPVTQDIWGTPTSPDRKIVPGIGFSPIGFRCLWMDKRAVKPYFLAKGGMLIFSQKALSQQATYENFSLQTATGLNVKMNERLELRLGLFSDFHFSNGFIVPVNPGLDVMNANLGVSYNFGKRGSGKREHGVQP